MDRILRKWYLYTYTFITGDCLIKVTTYSIWYALLFFYTATKILLPYYVWYGIVVCLSVDTIGASAITFVQIASETVLLGNTVFYRGTSKFVFREEFIYTPTNLQKELKSNGPQCCHLDTNSSVTLLQISIVTEDGTQDPCNKIICV
jgi:hypothetical protein